MRKFRRLIAHNRMKKSNYVHVNKGNPSYFAKHWREWV